MKWYIVFASIDTSPIEWDKLDAADVIYTFAGALRHLPPQRCRGKLLMVFLDKLVVGRSMLPAIGQINAFACDVYLVLPPSRLYEAEIKATRRLAGVIERATLLPWAQKAIPAADAQVSSQRRFLHFARRDHRFEGDIKGTDYVLELLDEFPHDVIGDVEVGHFLGWVPLEQQLALQRQCRLLLHPSRLDSASRMLSAALCLEQLPVLAFREAEYTFSLSFGQPPEEYLPRYFPIARGKQEFQDLVRRLMTDDELYHAALNNLREYKANHPLYWDALAVYQTFAERGLALPRDLTPLHHLLATPALLKSLPGGPWSANPLALNYV
jgi:hypothetical protein